MPPKGILATEFLDDHRALEPPDPIPNSVVKRCIADGSVGLPHVRVGHRQAPIPKPPSALAGGGLAFARKKILSGKSPRRRRLDPHASTGAMRLVTVLGLRP